jgi:hypothetical protein
MTDTVTTPAEAYVRFWNLEPEEQRALGREIFAPDVVQYAPIGVLTGLDALVGFTRRFAAEMGDYAYRRRELPESHHDRIRVRWELLRGDDSFAEGTDVLTLDESGRISTIATFLDRAPDGFNLDAQP